MGFLKEREIGADKVGGDGLGNSVTLDNIKQMVDIFIELLVVKLDQVYKGVDSTANGLRVSVTV